MRYFNERNIPKINLLGSLAIVLLLSGALGLLVLLDRYSSHQREVRELEHIYTQMQKDRIVRQVEEEIDTIDFYRQFARHRYMREMKEQVDGAHDLIMSIYKREREKIPSRELEEIIKDALRNLRFHDGAGYIFALDRDGVLQASGNDPHLEGSLMGDLQDENGRYFVREMLEIVSTNGEGYVEYEWDMPGQEGINVPKISYLRHFAPLDWGIGGGVYEASVDELVKKQVVKLLNEAPYQKNNPNYTFVYELLDMRGGEEFAAMLVNPNRPDLLGSRISDAARDAKGKLYRREFMEGLRTSGDALVEYWYRKPNDPDPKPKMAYFKLYPPWGWVVAKGFYFDDLRERIAIKQQALTVGIKQDMVRITLIVIIFVGMAVVLSLLISGGIGHILSEYKTKVEEQNRDLSSANEQLKQEVSDRKGAQQELIKANELLVERTHEAEAASRLKSEFLANVSHDIRTPMNSVLGMAQFLLESDLSEEQREYAATILDSGQVLLSLLNDILDLSKIEAGQLVIEPVPFNARETMEGMLRLVKGQAEGVQTKLSLVFGDEVPRYLVGDAARIQQVTLNLLTNAIKFTEKGDVTLTVSCPDRRDNTATLEVHVVDTGIGIPESAQDLIFERFMQADASTTRTRGGSGLGLAISKQLVEMMGGSLGVRSSPEKGSDFFYTLTLPIALPEQIPEQVKISVEPGYALPRSLRVLLVEDTVVNQKVAAIMLEKLGCDVIVCGNGREAVESFKSGRFDLIFMDCQMPVMDGYQATRVIRHMEDSDERIPIIAMTAHAMAGDRQRCIDSGMDDYISKPINRSSVAGILTKYAGNGSTRTDPLNTGRSKTESSPEILDSAFLFDLVKEDVALLGGLIETFLTEAVDKLREAEEAIKKNDMQAVARCAHAMKGASANLGGNALRTAAERLEATAGKAVIHDSTPEWLQFKIELDRFSDALRNLEYPDT